MTPRFDNFDLLGLLLRRKWHLLVIVVLAGVCAYVFSGEHFIKPKYKSTAVVYPVNIIPYSNESQTEQLLQLFNSSDVRRMMITRFNLATHYGIDTAQKSSLTRLLGMYDENVTIHQTEFASLKIDISDVNPDTACMMVNALIDFVNIQARTLQRSKTREVVAIFEHQLQSKQHQIDSLGKIMDELRVRYGLLDYQSQSKEATKNYLKLIGDGATPIRIRPVDSLMRNLEEKGGSLISVSDQMASLQDAYNSIKTDYDKAQSDLTKELTYSNVVAKPFPADSKSYPVRWLIAVVSIISAFIFGMILFVLLERFSNQQTSDGSAGKR